MKLDTRDSGHGGGHERPSHDMTSASKGRRRQVSTSIACLYDYCAESATKTNTLIDSYTATGREVRATGALHGPGGISPSSTCLSHIHATGAAPTSCRLSQPVFRLSWPLTLAHSPLTQHFSASDHVFSCPWVLLALAYNRGVQAVFC